MDNRTRSTPDVPTGGARTILPSGLLLRVPECSDAALFAARGRTAMSRNTYRGVSS